MARHKKDLGSVLIQALLGGVCVFSLSPCGFSRTHVRRISDSELFLRVSACLSLDVSPVMNRCGLTLGAPGRLPYDSCERRAGSAAQAGIENGRRVLESLT